MALITEDYEVAYMMWKDVESMSSAFQSSQGQAVVQDGQSLMNNLQWSNAADAPAPTVEQESKSGQFFSSIR